jgi:hypothetical protein
MKISYDKRKALRLLCFLLSALLVMTVSASVYNYMYINVGPVKVYAPKVYFNTGLDAGLAGASYGDNQTYAKMTSLSGWPNATRIYEDPLRIKNNDTTKDFTIELRVDSYTDDTTEVSSFIIRLKDASTGALKGTLTITTAGDTTGTLTINHGDEWRLETEIKWKAGALTSHKVNAVLKLVVTGEGTGE